MYVNSKLKNGVVILNYNSRELTLALINQIIDYDSIYKICVVDNNSNDNFDNDFNSSKIHYIRNEKNLGYNAGNNVGLRYLIEECQCDYVYIANPDVDFENSAICEMSNEMINDSKLVVCSTKRYGMNKSQIHQYFNFPSFINSVKKCFFIGRRNLESNKNSYQNSQIENAKGIFYVDAVPGAFFGIKSQFLKEIGYLYEGVFLYGEELFLGQQVHRLGYKSGIINTSCYYHNHPQQNFSKSNKKMFLYDRLSLIKYFKYFKLLNPIQLLILNIAVRLGSIEYNLLALIYKLLRRNKNNSEIKHIKCSHQAINYKIERKLDINKGIIDSINSPEKYMEYIADVNYSRFFELGYAIPGHNGPHGHLDTPVRNTAHYLIIYSYLYKKNNDKKYADICKKFINYLINKQKETKSGAIQCMETDKYDHLNGLIGQGWVIEALIYYYETFKDKKALHIAHRIFNSQKYNYDMHIWQRIELDGTNLGYDITYNHQVWFAACSYKLAKYCNDENINKIIKDFLIEGTKRDFRIYSNGVMKHTIKINTESLKKENTKKIIKFFLTPLIVLNPRKFDFKYIEKAYHIFDIYGFSILKEEYGELPIFSSQKYKKAIECAKDIKKYDKRNGIMRYLKSGKKFNIFSYSYNSPTFEYPYVAKINWDINSDDIKDIFKIQKELMFDNNTGLMLKNNPDIETYNAKTYEIIRYLDKINK